MNLRMREGHLPEWLRITLLGDEPQFGEEGPKPPPGNYNNNFVNAGRKSGKKRIYRNSWEDWEEALVVQEGAKKHPDWEMISRQLKRTPRACNIRLYVIRERTSFE